MMRVRPEEDKNAYRCCFCCHVTTGTILLGLWHLVVQMTVVIMFVVMVMHPELELPSPATGGAFVLAPKNAESEQKTQPITQSPNAEETKNIMFESIMSLYLDNNNGREKAGKEESSAWNSEWGKKLSKHHKNTTAEDRAVGVAVAASSLAITIMLIYGTARGRPGYIMPFFCLQAFDFCLSCLTVVGYLSYMPDIKKWIQSQPDLPYKDDLLALSPQTLDLLAISFFFAIVLVKAYFLGVVWATYRYLVNRMAPQMAVRESLSSLYFPMLSPVADRRHDFSDADADSEDQAENPGAPLLPPKYEDAIKAPKEESMSSIPPPPPYTPFAPGLF